jgi:cytidylate kinase
MDGTTRARPRPASTGGSATSPSPGARHQLIVAIDGPGSSGKSSVGAAAAARLGYRFFDTGLLYRGLTRLAIDRGVPDSDPAGLAALVRDLELAADEGGRLARVLAGRRDLTAGLHDPEVESRVSAISGIPEVRAALVGRQRALAAPGGIVMVGRDIGTVILPDADLKIYLDASVEERARRRAADRGRGGEAEVDEILAALRRRDALDSTRAVAPLRPASDALILQTDGNELDETIKLVVGAIQAAEREREDGHDDPGPTLTAAPLPSGKARRSAPRVVARALPVTPIAGHLTLLIRFCSLVARALAGAITRVRIEGDLAAIPREGPFILIANHASNADPIVVGAFIPPRIGRRLNWLGKREVFDVPVLGWLASHGGIHAVERSAVDVEAFRVAQRILAAGHPLAVFPEGTRSEDGQLQEVKDGLALLAQRQGVPIVPVGIADSDRVWPRGRRLPRIGGRIVVRVGKPFTLPPEPRGDPAARRRGDAAARRRAKGAASREMMGRLAALLPPRQRGAYADAVPDGAND